MFTVILHTKFHISVISDLLQIATKLKLNYRLHAAANFARGVLKKVMLLHIIPGPNMSGACVVTLKVCVSFILVLQIREM
jgi:hypothetical protein